MHLHDILQLRTSVILPEAMIRWGLAPIYITILMLFSHSKLLCKTLLYIYFYIIVSIPIFQQQIFSHYRHLVSS